jgi:hypothetical protein
MTNKDNHNKMLDEIINQPFRFGINGVIAAFKEPRVYCSGIKTVDIHFVTGKGDVLVEYKNSEEHKDYAFIQLSCYAEYMRLKPHKMVFIYGQGNVTEL